MKTKYYIITELLNYDIVHPENKHLPMSDKVKKYLISDNSRSVYNYIEKSEMLRSLNDIMVMKKEPLHKILKNDELIKLNEAIINAYYSDYVTIVPKEQFKQYFYGDNHDL